MRHSLKRHFRPLAQNARFISQGFQDPAPNWVKWRVLKKFFVPDGVCVETGTYLGETTNFLSRNYKKVYSLEPYFPLFASAKKRFGNRTNIEIINRTSELGFQCIVSELSGPANFWLDGHYSGEGTYENKLWTPIEHELSTIYRYLPQMKNVSIAIDDFRLFRSDRSKGYPSPNVLVEFANNNGFNWTVERDIFLIWSR